MTPIKRVGGGGGWCWSYVLEANQLEWSLEWLILVYVNDDFISFVPCDYY